MVITASASVVGQLLRRRGSARRGVAGRGVAAGGSASVTLIAGPRPDSKSLLCPLRSGGVAERGAGCGSSSWHSWRSPSATFRSWARSSREGWGWSFPRGLHWSPDCCVRFGGSAGRRVAVRNGFRGAPEGVLVVRVRIANRPGNNVVPALKTQKCTCALSLFSVLIRIILCYVNWSSRIFRYTSSFVSL